MDRATTLLRRLMLTWLTLCVAGFGVASFAAPVVVERDIEVETASEFYVSRESAYSQSGPRHRDKSSPPADTPETRTAEDLRASGAMSRDARICVFRQFPSLRTCETRIQI